MRLQDLQDRLRTYIRARISRRELTGSGLSHAADFRQGHLSNFLNSRRGLSLESMDRLLETLQIDMLDLVDPGEIQRRTLLPPDGADLESIAVVSAEHAARLRRFSSEQVVDTVSFRKPFLRRLKPNDICDRGDWLRFVSIKLDPKTVRAIFSASVSGANLLIDRHYTSLHPYRQHQPNLYAVSLQAGCAVGYVSVAGAHLVLRHWNAQMPVELARIDRRKGYSDNIAGRVCHVAIVT